MRTASEASGMNIKATKSSSFEDKPDLKSSNKPMHNKIGKASAKYRRRKKMSMTLEATETKSDNIEKNDLGDGTSAALFKSGTASNNIPISNKNLKDVAPDDSIYKSRENLFSGLDDSTITELPLDANKGIRSSFSHIAIQDNLSVQEVAHMNNIKNGIVPIQETQSTLEDSYKPFDILQNENYHDNLRGSILEEDLSLDKMTRPTLKEAPSLDKMTQSLKIEAADTNNKPCNRWQYHIKSVILHYGSHDSGHFTCLKNVDGEWYMISDASVDRCSGDLRRYSAHIYMVFYESE